MEPAITIFTPAYNRAHLLPLLYGSLKRQTNQRFKWLIIDDGSTDETRSLVEKWIEQETDFSIDYQYKKNGGLQTAYVEAIKHLTTELAMCVDSDDYLLDDSISKVLSLWEAKGSDHYAGICGLDMTAEGEIIGGKFPDTLTEINLIDIITERSAYKWADRKLVIRSELYKHTKPSKYYDDEKSLNEAYLHHQISMQKNYLLLNEPLIVVNYQEEGISKSKKRQYLNSPKSFADHKRFLLSLEGGTPRFYIRRALLYCMHCVHARKLNFLKDCPKKPLVLACYLPGVILAYGVRLQVRLSGK
ncbi:glycosyltransferase family 2 protein [Enterococcus sp. AZ109]|uniref:glycosyltransferase family 2 protein n=1 Tax=Enterococcus sp. AZ109 TaxID=2774634 RepID=UPI003F284468